MKPETIVTPLTPPFTRSHRSLREFPSCQIKYKNVSKNIKFQFYRLMVETHFQLYESCKIKTLKFDMFIRFKKCPSMYKSDFYLVVAFDGQFKFL